MLELLIMVLVVVMLVVAKRLGQIARILKNFKIEAVIPIYGTEDDPEPTVRPDNVVRGKFDDRWQFRRNVRR